MTSAPDRQDIVALITEAVDAGARESVACRELRLHPRTYQRWQGADGEVKQDLRPLAERPSPANRLSEDERDQIVATCSTAEFASLPPSQIVPRLADHLSSTRYRAPMRSRAFEADEFATLEWVDWFNNRRVLPLCQERCRPDRIWLN